MLCYHRMGRRNAAQNGIWMPKSHHLEEITMKKMISLFLTIALLTSLAGCAGTTVVVGNCTCPPEAHEPVETPTAAPDDLPPEGMLKTGLAILPSISKSTSATADANGKADFDVTVVAVTVDENGVIHDCVIDSVAVAAEIGAAGNPVDIAPGSTTMAANSVQVLSKKEKGYDYGMVASGSKYEWFEQAAALAQFAVGKTVDQVKGGYADDVDLATSASIYLGGYVAGIEAAVANAKTLGAEAGQELKMAVSASLETSVKEVGGVAQLNVDAVALTMLGDVITSCTIDSLQAAVEFDGTGTVTTDLSAAPKTKMQLGFDYGMVAYNASKIGLEWFEQVENFCAYVCGKTGAEVAGIAVTETTAPSDVDLAAECSIAIGGFQALIAKAIG